MNIEHFPFEPGSTLPLSKAVAFDDLVYLSGQGPYDPSIDTVYTGPDFGRQTHLVMQAIAKQLDAIGSDFDHVLKATVFTTDITKGAAINEAYRSYFADKFPARTMVQVAALPREMGVEIEVVAVRNRAKENLKVK